MPAAPAITDGRQPILRVSNLRVELGGSEIFRDLSFELHDGETIVVLGPNGAGKTVLMRSLLGLLPSQGEIRWRPGIRIGYVPQRIPISRDLPMTIADFFALQRVDRAAASPVLDAVGMAGTLDRQLGLLSSGQFQRVLIAWALAKDPDVLLFDEPTAGVDLGGEETIHALLRKTREKRKFGLILVTHELSLVYGEADHVLCMSGAHSCFGPPDEILDPETLKSIYGREIRFFRHTHE